MLMPRGRRAEELGLAQNLDSRRRTRRRRIPFHQEYLDIIDAAREVTLAALELSIEPASAANSMRLKVAARVLKRGCNRLTYKLLRKATNS
jgi:hypothetical protein